jgi:hypothetical protein
MFRIDDRYFNVEFLADDGYVQNAEILNGENSGRLQGTGEMYLEYIGTFINSSCRFIRSRECTDQEWNEFYRTLINPINKHNVDVPFDNGILTLDVYFTGGKRNVRKIILNNGTRTPVWVKTIEVNMTAIGSNWIAGGELTGYLR